MVESEWHMDKDHFSLALKHLNFHVPRRHIQEVKEEEPWREEMNHLNEH